jgi:hypothetical protein
MEETDESDDVLKRIPEEELTARQREFFKYDNVKDFTHYELRRDPSRLDEFDREKCRNIAIWRKNDTVIFECSKDDLSPSWRHYRRCVFFYMKDTNYQWRGAIFGETADAVAETATVFWSMKQNSDAEALLCILCMILYHSNCNFDFTALRPEQLAQILDSNPTRTFELHTGQWTREHSAILASRPYLLKLKLGELLEFMDIGTEFVNVLAKRQSSFGSLHIDYMDPNLDTTCLKPSDLSRLLKLDVFENLDVRYPHGECVILTFSAKVKVLHCSIYAEDVAPDDFKSLNIVTSDLSVKFFIGRDDDWVELLTSFFDRVAELGHFERLSIGAEYSLRNCLCPGNVNPVAQALIRAIDANPKLSYLDLSNFRELDSDSDSAIHFENIVRSMGQHIEMCTIVVNTSRVDFSWLEQQLSRNRNIEVLDSSRKRVSNGSTIDNLYVLNQFYRESKNLVNESSSERLSLTSSALLNSASNSLQRTALLLADHTDVLCECIQDLDVDAAGAVLASDPVLGDSERSAPSKRDLEAQDYPLAKKASRDE